MSLSMSMCVIRPRTETIELFEGSGFLFLYHVVSKVAQIGNIGRAWCDL